MESHECPDCQMGRGFIVCRVDNGLKRHVHMCVRGHEQEVQPSVIERRAGTDADVFYLWQNVMNKGVYKVGITSERCSDDRIENCAYRNGMKANIIFKLATPNAREIERKALQMGEPVDYPATIDGYTEFRRYTDKELGAVYKMAVNSCK